METACDQDSSGDDTYSKLQVEFIGSTVDGGPILRFLGPLPKPMRLQGDVLGYSDDNRPIIAYRKGVVTFAPGPESAAPSKEVLDDSSEQ